MQPKRLIISVLVVILMLGAAVMSVAAAPKAFELKVEVNATSAIVTNGPVIMQPGDEIEISVKILDNPGVNMFSANISYDANSFEPVKDENGDYVLTWGTAVEGATVKTCVPAKDRFNNEIEGEIYCFIFDKTADKDNKKTGEVVTLKFKVKELFHGDAKVSISSDDAIIMSGDSSSQDVTTKLEKNPTVHIHDIISDITRVEADCENNGTVTFTCSGCGEVTEVTEPAKRHVVVNDAAVPATCTTTGLTAGQHCSVCNKVIKEQTETPLAPHTLGPDATCEDPQKCTVCDKELVPAAHTIVDDAAVEATCTTPGKTAGQHCSVCNVVIVAQQDIPVKDHTPGAEATCTTAQICTVCNTEIAPKKEHTPGAEATCTTAQICTVCNAEIAPKKEHTPGAEATCTAAQTCTVCNAEIAPKKAHTIVEDAAVEATCKTAGKTAGKHCSVCNEVIEAQTEIPVKEHTVVVDEAIEPTMSKEGKTEGEHCSVCGEILKAQETVAKKSSLWIWLVIGGVLVLAGGAVGAVFFIKKKKTEK